jgi:hypothetical protein
MWLRCGNLSILQEFQALWEFCPLHFRSLIQIFFYIVGIFDTFDTYDTTSKSTSPAYLLSPINVFRSIALNCYLLSSTPLNVANFFSSWALNVANYPLNVLKSTSDWVDVYSCWVDVYSCWCGNPKLVFYRCTLSGDEVTLGLVFYIEFVESFC